MIPELQIFHLKHIEEMLQTFSLIQQLTPKLTQEQYRIYLEQMIPHRYCQIAARSGSAWVGVSGYWVGTKLYCGKYLEVDNFVVDEIFRSQKIGEAIFQKLEQIAIHENCDVMMLDAYLQNTRAHHFYEKFGLKAKGFHFIKKINNRSGGHECME